MRAASFLVITGDGINCERETALAFEKAGARVRILHINQLLETPSELEHVQGLVFPGGFSFGDELGSGQILALKMRHRLADALTRFLEQPRAILGICNGFQVLVKLGVLPFKELKRGGVALARNDHGQFIDRWVELEVNHRSPCAWLSDLPERVAMPIRHGEGRIVLDPSKQTELARELEQKELWAFRYTEDVNGSHQRIAGLTDESGWVLGLMPHPEAASFGPQAPFRVLQGTLPAFGLFTSIQKRLWEA